MESKLYAVGYAPPLQLKWLLAASWAHLLPQLWCVMRASSNSGYLRHRSLILWCSRLLRLATVVTLYAGQDFQSALVKLAATTPDDAWQLKAAAHLSAAVPWVALSGTINFPLAFRHQLLASLLFFAAGLALTVPATNCALQHPSSQVLQGAEAACGAVLGNLLGLAQLLTGAFPGHQGTICRGLGSSLHLQLFLLCFSTALGLQLSYWGEQRTRQRWMQLVGRPVKEADESWSWSWGDKCVVMLTWAMLCASAALLLKDTGLFDLQRCAWHGR